MRLLIVGMLGGHITEAGKIALASGAKVIHAESVERALEALRTGAGVDLVMIDVELNVEALITAMKQERIATEVVACGVKTDARAAVKAIQAGAKEYVPLPPDAELIAAVLQAASEDSKPLISRDAVMAQVLSFADKVAPSDASILITGESGTGKEVMARYIHQKSKRATKPFVSLNCAAIPENLLESELFGHEKGAFTGAVARRVGKFEEANGGTLLLDEISEMDVRLQAKLLRAIQEKVIDRVGGTAPVKIDIRVIATSNRNLENEVAAGNFREDLYFRLNVINVALPALRERPGDIAVLAGHFVNKFADANGVPERPISKAAHQRLQSHHWRGNVRELENTMHRAVLVATGDEIEPEDIILSGEDPTKNTAPRFSSQMTGQTIGGTGGSGLRGSGPLDMADPASPMPGNASELVGKTVAEVERDLILGTLDHCLGNRTHAANILGISIRTLRNKLKQYTQEGVQVPAAREGLTA